MIFVIRPNPYILRNQTPHCSANTKTATTTSTNNNAMQSTSPKASNPSAAKRIVLEKTPLHRDENEKKTSLSMDVAGFSLDQISVQLEDHVLTVSAERTNHHGDVFVMHRRFAMRADLYVEESVSANLEDGVLELTIHKHDPKSRTRQIPIQTGTAGTSTATNTTALHTDHAAENSISSEDITTAADEKEVRSEMLNKTTASWMEPIDDPNDTAETSASPDATEDDNDDEDEIDDVSVEQSNDNNAVTNMDELRVEDEDSARGSIAFSPTIDESDDEVNQDSDNDDDDDSDEDEDDENWEQVVHV